MLTAADFERAALLLDPQAVYELGDPGDGSLTFTLWESEAHPDIPTLDDIDAVLAAHFDPARPDWQAFAEALLNSDTAKTLFPLIAADPIIQLHATLMLGLLVNRPLRQHNLATIERLFQSILHQAAARDIAFDPAAVAAWNALCDQTDMPPGLRVPRPDSES